MKKTFNCKTLVLMLALVLAMSFTACSGTASGDSNDNPGGDKNTGSMTGTIKISGSVSAQPLLQELSEGFKSVESGISVDIQGGGSAKGIADAAGKVSDIGISSRSLNNEEKNSGLTEQVIAYDAIAVVTHPDNTVSNLTKEQITKIYKGEIKNWKDVGGPDMEILVASREEGSGIKEDFEELLQLSEAGDGKPVSLVRADTLTLDGLGAVKAIIASKSNAIGYMSLGSADNSVKKLSVDGVECTADNVEAQSYPLSQPFIIITAGDSKPEPRAFIDYMLGENGQQIIGNKYIKAK